MSAFTLKDISQTTTLIDIDDNGNMVISGAFTCDGVITFGAGNSAILDASGLATGEADIVIADNLADALTIRQGANPYLTFISTNGSESIAAYKALTTTDGVASGPTRRIGGRVNEDIAAGTALTASASETVLGTYTIPANTLKQRTRLHVRAMVAVTANNSTTTLTARMRLGGLTGTALITTAAVDTSAGHIVVMDFDLVSRADPSDASSLCGSGWYCDPGAVGGATKVAALAATNFDTNSDLDLVITGQWSAADANSCALQILSVDAVG